MRATTNPISTARLGAALSITSERARQLVAQFGFEVVADPNRLHEALLDHGNRSRLRTLLSDPTNRAEISNKLTAQP